MKCVQHTRKLHSVRLCENRKRLQYTLDMKKVIKCKLTGEKKKRSKIHTEDVKQSENKNWTYLKLVNIVRLGIQNKSCFICDSLKFERKKYIQLYPYRYTRSCRIDFFFSSDYSTNIWVFIYDRIVMNELLVIYQLQQI